jgi:hypothetical protein
MLDKYYITYFQKHFFHFAMYQLNNILLEKIILMRINPSVHFTMQNLPTINFRFTIFTLLLEITITFSLVLISHFH